MAFNKENQPSHDFRYEGRRKSFLRAFESLTPLEVPPLVPLKASTTSDERALLANREESSNIDLRHFEDSELGKIEVHEVGVSTLRKQLLPSGDSPTCDMKIEGNDEAFMTTQALLDDNDPTAS